MKKTFLKFFTIFFLIYSIGYLVSFLLYNSSTTLKTSPTGTSIPISEKFEGALIEISGNVTSEAIETELAWEDKSEKDETSQAPADDKALTEKIIKQRKVKEPEDRAATEISKTGKEKAAKDVEYLTIQISSSKKIDDAEQDFAKLSAQLSKDENEFLRIEKVKSYYAVRLGKFQKEGEAKIVLAKLRGSFPGAFLLRAFIKPERIVRSNETFAITDAANVDFPDNNWPKENIEKLKAEAVAPGIDADEIIQKKEIARVKEVVVTEAVIEKFESSIVGEGKEDTENTLVGVDKRSGTEKKVGISDLAQSKREESKVAPEEAVEFSYEVVKVITEDDNGKELKGPLTVFYDHSTDELFSISRGRIIIYGADYFPLNSFGEGRGLNKAIGGVIDAKGKMYICQDGDQENGPLLSILNPAFIKETDIPIKEFEEADTFSPSRVAIGAEGRIYLISKGSPMVLVLGNQGQFLRWFEIKARTKEKGENTTEKISDEPFPVVDISADKKGNLFFLSETLGKVYVFNANEEYVFSFGTKGGSTGKLSRPRGISLDEKRGAIYVVDYFRHTVLIYDYSGNFKFQLGGRGWSPGWFDFPVDVAVSNYGYLVVADFFNDRIQAFKVNLPDDFSKNDTRSLDNNK